MMIVIDSKAIGWTKSRVYLENHLGTNTFEHYLSLLVSSGFPKITPRYMRNLFEYFMKMLCEKQTHIKQNLTITQFYIQEVLS